MILQAPAQVQPSTVTLSVLYFAVSDLVAPTSVAMHVLYIIVGPSTSAAASRCEVFKQLERRISFLVLGKTKKRRLIFLHVHLAVSAVLPSYFCHFHQSEVELLGIVVDHIFKLASQTPLHLHTFLIHSASETLPRARRNGVFMLLGLA